MLVKEHSFDSAGNEKGRQTMSTSALGTTSHEPVLVVMKEQWGRSVPLGLCP